MKKIWKNITATYESSLSLISLITFRAVGVERPSRQVANIANLIVIVMLVFTGDRLLSGLLEQINLKTSFRYSSLYNGTAERDMVLIGNSRGHAFYQPAITTLTNASTINLSYNALPVSIARALVEDYFDLYEPPKKIILEVSMLNKNELNVINGFKLYLNQSERIRSVIEANSSRTAAACNIANLYAFNTEVFHRSLYYMNKQDDDWMQDKKISEGLVKSASAIEPMDFELTQDRLNDLKALVTKARERNTKVELVLSPYYPAYKSKIMNLQNFITRIEQSTGLKVRDYSSLIQHDEHFADYLHLNKKGSEIYIEQLKRDGVL